MWRNEAGKTDYLPILFELSLAVGQSIQSKSNCSRFLKALCATTDANCASVWSVRRQDAARGKQQFELICDVSPTGETEEPPLRITEIWAHLQEKEDFVLKVPGRGQYSFFRLQTFGMLGVCHPEGSFPLLEEARPLFKKVIDKLAVSLQGAYAFHQLQQVEQQVSQIEQKQRQIIDTALDVVFLVDGFARVIEWGRRAQELFGFTAREIVGRRWYHLLRREEEWLQLDAFVEQFNKTGQFPLEANRPFVVIVQNKAGREFPVEINYSHLNIDGEDVVCFYLRDITERQAAETELTNTRLRLESLLTNMQAGIIVEDDNGRIVLANDFLCRIFDMPLPASNLHGVNCAEAARSIRHMFTDPEGFLQRIDELLHRKEVATEDILFLTNGKILERDYIPILFQDRYLGHMWQYRDITERKRSENELREAKLAAEEAKQAERQFLTFMSHEIRTPMNAVIGMIHLLEETELSPRQQEYMSTLKFSADSLLRIINNVLDLSKIEAGEIEFDQHRFKIQDLLLALQQSFQYRIRNKPVSVELRIDPRLDHLVIGDYTRLNQILTNLLNNAVKFTEKGRVTLDVELLGEKPEQYMLEFIVCDTGIGIEEKELPYVFERYKQVGRGGSHRYGGTGLGLAIVRQLVQLQGGTITLESKSGVGTKVRFSLPIGRSDVPVSYQAPSSDTSEEDWIDIDSRFLDTARILVVEDNYLNQRLMQKVLENWGGSFHLASDGQEALVLTQQIHFDVILMDLHMPGLDGFETTRLIRQDADNPNVATPIVALTAAALLEERKKVFEVGINDFVTKPFSPRVLKGVLFKWLKGRASQAPSDLDPAPQHAVSVFQREFPFLYDFSSGDEQFIREMIATFLEEVRMALQQLRQALLNKEFHHISRIAHRLQPNLQMMELPRERELIEELQQLTAEPGQSEIAKVENLIKQLEECLAPSLQHMRELLA